MIVVACLVLFGWASDRHWLTDLIPGAPSMKPNTALMFILGGTSLFLLTFHSEHALFAARICTVTTGALAALTLLEYFTNWNLGIDELLFADPWTKPEMHPGRTGLGSTFCISLLCVALWALSSRAPSVRKATILNWVGLFLVTFAIESQLAYLEFFNSGYTWWNVLGMAIHTAGLFLLLGVSFLWTCWKQSTVPWLIPPWITAIFVCQILILLTLTFNVHRSTSTLVQETTWLRHTHSVLTAVRELRNSLGELHRSARGYESDGLSSSTPLSDIGITEAGNEVLKRLSNLGDISLDDPLQQPRFSHLPQPVSDWLEFTRELIVLRRNTAKNQSEQEYAKNRSQLLLNLIRAGLTEMEQTGNNAIKEHEDFTKTIIVQTFAMLPAGALLSVIFLGYGLLRTNNEITKLKQATDSLQDSESRLRLAMDAAQLGDWDLDLITHAAGRSLRHDQIFGYNQLLPEWTYELFMKHVHPKDQDRISHVFQRTMETGEALNFECRIIRQDGSPGWIWARGNLTRDGTGRPIRMNGVVGDVTERRKAEEEVRELNRTLEQRVQERTAKLEMAVHELDTFSYSVSHDLRAPLRAVDGFSRMVLEEYTSQLDANGRRMLEVIRSETTRMSRLIDDLLTFSRLGRQNVESESIDMMTLVHELTQMK